MDVIYKKIDELKEYDRNAKLHPNGQIKNLADSMKEFGFVKHRAIAIDRNGVIVEGHGRLEAARKLGMKEVPTICIDDMTEEQIKKWRIVENVSAGVDYDQDLLLDEWQSVLGLDTDSFGLSELSFGDLDGFDEQSSEQEQKEEKKTKEDDNSGWYGDERERTVNYYNLHEFDDMECEGFFQMPTLDPCDIVPSDIISFNYMLTAKNKDCGVHFYVDDYQFERIWTSPFNYMDKLVEFECCFTPDFSLYTEMPIAMQVWNIYRSRLIGQIMQREGIHVIPTVSWCREDSFEFCFDGLPKNSTLSISTIGVKKNKEGFELWKAGVDEMIERLHPKRLLIYGGAVDYDYGDIEVVYYKNHTTERMANNWKQGRTSD